MDNQLISKHASLLACPECKGALRLKSTSLFCQTCRAEYDVDKGIANFAAGSGFFYREKGLDHASMTEAVSIAETQGWEKALAYIHATTNLPAAEFDVTMFNASKSAWKLFLNMRENAVALDLGCGWGGLTFSLAQNYKLVVAMDLTPERVAMAYYHARSRGLDNVLFLCGGDSQHLPFAPDSLDLVVLNGVLERVPEGLPGRPKDLQLKFLREICRILRPDGQVYIGIENRTSIRYFFGRPEEHVNLRYISLMPRPLADIYSRILRRAPYRNHTYTLGGYRRLLRDAGFPDTKGYYPHPMYWEIEQLTDLDSKKLAKLFTGRSVKRKLATVLLERMGLLKFLCPSLSLVASKKTNTPNFLDSLLQQLQKTLFPSTEESLQVQRIVVTDNEWALVFIDTTARELPYFVLRLPLSQAAHTRACSLTTILQSVADAYGDKPFSRFLPRTLAQGTFNTQTWFVETYIDGKPFAELHVDGVFKQHLLSEAVDAISLIHQDTITNPMMLSDMVQSILRRVVLAEQQTEIQKAGGSKALEDFAKRILTKTKETTAAVPRVLEHGDYTFANCIVAHHSERIIGIIDWDQALTDGIPLVDFLSVLVAAEADRAQVSSLQAYPLVLSKLLEDHFHQSLLNHYLSRVQVTQSTLKLLLALFPFYNITRFYETRKSTAAETRDRFAWQFQNLDRMIQLVDRFVR